MSESDRPRDIAHQLRETTERLIERTREEPPGKGQGSLIRKDIVETIEELSNLLVEMDPIRQPGAMFDPGNPAVIGRCIGLALVAQPRAPLVSIEAFYGSGVYALYYTGDFPLYAPLSKTETPIYVGKADPDNQHAATARDQGTKLFGRLKDHRRSIAKVTSTLDIDDFEYRALVVQTGWEAGAEDFLIRLFNPLWNNETDVLYGIGKHGDSAGTRGNSRSPWDTLHPGRSWAADARLPDAKSPSQIAREVVNHFAKHPSYPDIDAVLHDFIEELRQL